MPELHRRRLGPEHRRDPRVMPHAPQEAAKHHEGGVPPHLEEIVAALVVERPEAQAPVT